MRGIQVSTVNREVYSLVVRRCSAQARGQCARAVGTQAGSWDIVYGRLNLSSAVCSREGCQHTAHTQTRRRVNTQPHTTAHNTHERSPAKNGLRLPLCIYPHPDIRSVYPFQPSAAPSRSNAHRSLPTQPHTTHPYSRHGAYDLTVTYALIRARACLTLPPPAAW